MFHHADNYIQNIGPVGGWEMDERDKKFMDLWIMTESGLLGEILRTRVRVPVPPLMLCNLGRLLPLRKPISQSAEVGAWPPDGSPGVLAPTVQVVVKRPLAPVQQGPR